VTPLEIVHSNVAITYGDAEKARFVRSAHPVFSFAVKPGLLSFLSIQDVPDPQDPANWRSRSSLAGWGERMTRWIPQVVLHR